MSMPHPDFELYDNIGRSTEQITAHRTNQPTNEDLHRWASRDAQQFTEALPDKPAGPGISAWTDHLPRARTVAELNSVTKAVLGDDQSALSELHLFLEAAAEWCERNQEPSIAGRYRRCAQELAALGDRLAHLSEDHLAGAYRSTRPVSPPVPSPAKTTGKPRPPRR
ncbi:hypothetical protein [Streptomyces diastaticus]|uniref:hypothetical protein n=1 Tax=Streptomyces diastaticus TaxID=1956 RepID=UPI00364A4523